MLRQNWKNFCIVGIGNHIVRRIIPALENENKNILGIVTSSRKEFNYKKFSSLSEALIFLPEDTAFILGSPPEAHFIQAQEILKFGRDIIIEKPIFVSAKEVKEIIKIPNFKKNIVIEGFMHRYTKIYSNFINYFEVQKDNIKSIKSNFYIPEIPTGTFRDNDKITSSCLYDMGSYGLSLINDIGLNLKPIYINSFSKQNLKPLRFGLKGNSKNVSVEILFGKNKNYENYVELTTFNKKKLKFSPFFYGIEANKTILEQGISKNVTSFTDNNGFQEMFNLNLNHLRLSQEKRFCDILKVTKKLENLAKQFELITN